MGTRDSQIADSANDPSATAQQDSSNAHGRVLFLMRHAETDLAGNLTENGERCTKGVASAFCEWITLLDPSWTEPITIRRAPNPESGNTAACFKQQFSDRAITRGDRVINFEDGEPLFESNVARSYGPYTHDLDHKKALIDEIAGESKCSDQSESPLLVVANDPLISGLASGILSRGRNGRRRIALAKAEIVCLERDPGDLRWRWSWSMTEDDKEQEEALRGKIKSKMSTATALGGLIVGLLTFLIERVISQHSNWLQWSAMALLAAAGVLYFATLFLYDTLQMPTRFWIASEWLPIRLLDRQWLPARPPSSTARVMHAAMIHIWMRIFIPATMFVGLAIVLLAAGATVPNTPTQAAPVVDAIGTTGILAAAVVASLAWVGLQRPPLGTSD